MLSLGSKSRTFCSNTSIGLRRTTWSYAIAGYDRPHPVAV